MTKFIIGRMCTGNEMWVLKAPSREHGPRWSPSRFYTNSHGEILMGPLWTFERRSGAHKAALMHGGFVIPVTENR